MAVGNPISLTDNVASRIVSQTATASQTDFTISGGYRLNAISVYRNGVRLISGRDYSAADGSTVVLLSPATASDSLEFHIFDDFRVADAIVSNASHQNIEGNLTVTGILTASNLIGSNLELQSLTVTNDVSIGGTLTYQDVTNIDSVGIITARTDVHVGAGLSVVGVSTFHGNAIFNGNVDLGNASGDTITATGRFDSDLIPSVDDQKDLGSATVEWRDLYLDGTANIDTLSVSGNSILTGEVSIGTTTGGKTLTLYGASSSSFRISKSGVLAYDHTFDGSTYTIANNNGSAGIPIVIGTKTSGEESLRIDSAGLVGIGTNAPGASLQINSATPKIILQDNDNGADISVASIGGAAVYSAASDTIFQTANTSERLRITSGGSVGIGTNNPDKLLHISGSSAPTIRIENTSAGAQVGNLVGSLEFEGQDNNAAGVRAKIDAEYRGVGAATAIKIYTAWENETTLYESAYFTKPTIKFTTNNVERLRITSAGLVGIGTDDPNRKLVISQANSTAYSGTDFDQDYHVLKLNNTTDSKTVGMQFLIGSNGEAAITATETSDGNTDLIFGIRGGGHRAERLRITSAGSVKIGSSNVVEINPSNEYPSIRPTLDLNFAATKILDPTITFTRDSIGTFTDELGIVRYASNNVPRFDHDPTTGESLGLLIEESRTNLVSYSEYTGTTVQTSGTVDNWGLLFTGSGSASLTPGIDAPDGSNNAVRFTNNNTGDSILRLNINAFTPNGSDTYILSFWARAISGTGGMSCDLADGSPNGTWTDQLVTNKWVRIVKSGVPSNASKTFIDLISNINNNRVVDFWGVQLEAGAFITSYIPTNGSTVIRKPDHAFIRDVRVFNFFNETEGTVLFEHTDVPQTTVARYPAIGFSQTNTVTSTRAIQVFFSTNNQDVYYLVRGSGSYPASDVVTIGASSGFELAGRVAFVYKANDFVLARNGTIVGTDSSGALPDDCFGLSLGGNGFSDYQFLNAHIKRFSYYPKRLPNAQLQGLTQQ